MRFFVVTMGVGWLLLLAGCGADEGQNWPGDGTGDTGSPPADTAVDSLPADTGGGTDTMPPDTIAPTTMPMKPVRTRTLFRNIA